MGSKIENMERLTGFCSHESIEFSHIGWDGQFGLDMLSCAICDLMMCALPDYVCIVNKDEYDGLISN